MDEWVKVGSAPNETMALMMEGLLKGADIPLSLIHISEPTRPY